MTIMQAIRKLFGIGSTPKDPAAPPTSKKTVLAHAKAAIDHAEKTCEVFDRDSAVLVTNGAGADHPAGG